MKSNRSLINNILSQTFAKIDLRLILFLIILFGVIFLAFSIMAYIASLNSESLPEFTEGWWGFFERANYLVIGYFMDWGGPLAMYVTFILAFAAFWVISDTRHFRHLDDRTKAISNINVWTAETLKCLSIPARFSIDIDELKRNLTDCRVELMIKVAESIKVFQDARGLVAETYTDKRTAKALETAINDVDKTLRSFITELFEIKIATVSEAELSKLIDKVMSTTDKLRKLLEAISNIS